jgi:hypothetical protein
MSRTYKIDALDWKGTLGRICIKCEKRYMPNGRTQRICDKCQDKINERRIIKMRNRRKK